jgi:gas vesicle protein
VGTRADELKAEIEGTRADLTGTMNEVGERVSPRRIVTRRTDRIRQKVTSVRETIMGAADQAGSAGSGIPDHASRAIGSAVDTARQAPQSVVTGTQGNPLAAGLIAFGAGMLLASVLPASNAEEQAATRVLDKAQPAISQAREAAQDVTDDLKDTLSGAAQDLRSTAGDAVVNVQDQGKSAVREVTSTASGAASDVKDHARDSASTLKDQAQS